MDEDSDDVKPRKSRMPKCNTGSPFTAEQEQFIIDTREVSTLTEDIDWAETSRRFNTQFPGSPRTQGALQVHYSRSLQPNKRRQTRRNRRSTLTSSFEFDGDEAIPDSAGSGGYRGSGVQAPSFVGDATASAVDIPLKSTGPNNVLTDQTSPTIKRERPTLRSPKWKFEADTDDILMSGRKRTRANKISYLEAAPDSDEEVMSDLSLAPKSSHHSEDSLARGLNLPPGATDKPVKDDNSPRASRDSSVAAVRSAGRPPSTTPSNRPQRRGEARRSSGASNPPPAESPPGPVLPVRRSTRPNRPKQTPLPNLITEFTAEEEQSDHPQEGSRRRVRKAPERFSLTDTVFARLDSASISPKTINHPATRHAKSSLANTLTQVTEPEPEPANIPTEALLNEQPANVPKLKLNMNGASNRKSGGGKAPLRQARNKEMRNTDTLNATEPRAKKQKPDAVPQAWDIIHPSMLPADPHVPAIFRNLPDGRVLERSNRGKPPSIRMRWLREGEQAPIFAGIPRRFSSTGNRRSRPIDDSTDDDTISDYSYRKTPPPNPKNLRLSSVAQLGRGPGSVIEHLNGKPCRG